MTDNYYLDVGVVRIQQWLSRTPQLRGRRGASTLLRKATKNDEVQTKLAEIAELAMPQKETGEVDGVVSLQLHRSDEQSVQRVERAIVNHLREQLPAASLKTTLRKGPSYVEARTQPSPLSETEWLAALAEWPPGRPCQSCQVWPATTTEYDRVENKDLAICEDCRQRRENAGYNTSSKHKPGPEKDLVKHAAERHLVPDLPDEFQSLAIMDDPRETHVATIQADGNSIGSFIATARCKARDEVREIPAAIQEATWAALLDAIEDITTPAERDRCLPVIPHLVGGDDVLLSVPARRGWTFARTFQQRFTERLDESGKVPEPLRDDIPTASIGLVFHHHTAPFFAFTELSEKLLDQAKREHRGMRPALAWQEVTQDGMEPVQRTSILHEDLVDCWPALQELWELQQSTRQRLAMLLNDPASFNEHVARMDLTSTVDRFEKGPIDLQSALKMVRWWQS